MASALTNGHARFHDPILVKQIMQLAGKFREMTQTQNLGVQGRFLWESRGTGQNPDPRRDFNDEFGWPRVPTPDLYDELYNHDCIAAKAIMLPVVRCWRVSPMVYEIEKESRSTDFERSFDELPSSLRGEMNWYRPRENQGGNPYFAACRRLDALGRKGRYGVMWHVTDDGLDPRLPPAGIAENHSMPVEFVKNEAKFRYVGQPPGDRLQTHRITRNQEAGKRKLVALKPFSESMAQVTRWEGNPASPRYLQPVEYLITEIDPNVGYTGLGLPIAQQNVHWARCTHYADVWHHAVGGGGQLATPALQVPLREILNGIKISGASPEGYYRAVIARLFFETLPQFGADAIVDEDSIADMMEELDNGMQKHGVLKGLHANQPANQVVDPTPHLDAGYKRLAIYLNKPKRIFEGSERGELSSSQDEIDSAADDSGRQNEHLSPNLIAPMINTDIALGVLAEPGEDGFTIEWPPLYQANEETKAKVFATRQQGFAAAIGANVPAYLGDVNFLTREAGFTQEEAEEILDEQERQALEEEQAAREKADELGAEEQPPEGFAKPEPEEPEQPVKVKDGEKLVFPSQADNAFCPTGPGGGIDATCSPGGPKMGPDTGQPSGGGGGGGGKASALASAYERAATMPRDEFDAVVSSVGESSVGELKAALDEMGLPHGHIKGKDKLVREVRAAIVDRRGMWDRGMNSEPTWNEIAGNAFDPDQPRDENGRWESGGGSSGERLKSAVERMGKHDRDDADIRGDRAVADRAVAELSKLPQADVFSAMTDAGIEGIRKSDSKKTLLTRMHNHLTARVRARERAEV